MLKYIKGDVTNPVGDGPKLICHVCNNKCAMGAGVALALANKFPIVYKEYALLYETDGLELGTVQYVDATEDIVVANMIAQNGFRSKNNPMPLDYKALEQCLEDVAEFINRHGLKHAIHAPKFGSALAGGDWNEIEKMINEMWNKIEVTVYEF